MGNPGLAQVFQPGGWLQVKRVTEPGVAVAGKHHLKIRLTKRAFGAGDKDAARLGHCAGDLVLTAQAILQ